jgi:hypothetical protein
MQKPLALLAALAAALAVVAAAPSVAHAGMPCWKRVILDYTDPDGKITGHYSRPCLRKAMKNAPEDLRDYTSIIDDISALLYDSGATQGGNGTTGGTSNGTMNPAATASERAAAEKERARKANAAVAKAGTRGSVPDASHSIPLPLILLAAIGLAAALAAASPPLFKRFRGRFPRLRPAHGSVRPPS